MKELLKSVSEKKKQLKSEIPIAVKISPDISENQIDLGFCISKRNGINENNEILTKFSINMLIGDLWLIKGKRR